MSYYGYESVFALRGDQKGQQMGRSFKRTPADKRVPHGGLLDGFAC